MLTSAFPAMRAYQTEGADWVHTQLRDTRAVLLGDDPGLGKSRQVLRAAEMGGYEDILIAGPACSRHVWRNEILKWHPSWASRILVVEPGVMLMNIAGVELAQKGRIIIISYDMLPQSIHWKTLLRKRHGDLLILDEAHYLKNQSGRTDAVYGAKGSDEGIQARYAHTILVSGTITPNHAGELYQHARTFWPEAVLHRAGPGGQPFTITEAEFQERYTRFKPTPWGRQIIGSRNQKALRDKMGRFVLRRRKQDVLPELPPLQAQDIPLVVRPIDRQDFIRSTASPQRPLQAVVDSTYLTRDDELLAQLHDDDTPLASLRRLLGELKVDPAAAWIAERLECGIQKMLVFGWHLHVLARLHRALAAFDPVLVTGETSPKGRELAEDMFQTRPNVRVFIGQTLACGHAITLTAATEVAIVEPSWVPSQNSQAIDRAHRMGQHDSVLASFLYVPGTIDEHIMAAFRRKAEETALIHDHYKEPLHADV